MQTPIGVPAALILVSAVACGGHSGPAAGAGSTVGTGSSGGVPAATAGSVLYVASVGVAPANDATVAQITAYDVATMTPIGSFSAFPTAKSIPFAPTMLGVAERRRSVRRGSLCRQWRHLSRDDRLAPGIGLDSRSSGDA